MTTTTATKTKTATTSEPLELRELVDLRLQRALEIELLDECVGGRLLLVHELRELHEVHALVALGDRIDRGEVGEAFLRDRQHLAGPLAERTPGELGLEPAHRDVGPR